MNKKILPILIGPLIIIASFQAIATLPLNFQPQHYLQKTITFSQPILSEQNEYTTVHLQESSTMLQKEGYPQVPLIPYSFELPIGSKNIQLTVRTSKEKQITIPQPLQPTPPTLTRSHQHIPQPNEAAKPADIYTQNQRYPAHSYDIHVSCGINQKKVRTLQVSIYLYPVQYNPVLQKIYTVDEATITCTYTPPQHQTRFSDEYDLLIIGPAEFSDAIQPLVTHKNENGIQTRFTTTEDIYDEFTGDDKPEQIKYYIKHAIETYNISSVLLIGGLKKYYNADDRDGQSKGVTDWYLPVRYTNIKKQGLNDPGTISDLYYADIYKYEENQTLFEDWDSNDNGVYAEWDLSITRDRLDLNPDVFIGRLPCRNKFEVRTVVNKIITYEQSTPSEKTWYNKMIAISGLSHATFNGQPDGEYLTDIALDYMDPIIDEEVKLYSSHNGTDKPLPIPKDIRHEISQGAGFVIFEGHGHPLRWDTHPVDNTNVWIGGFQIKNMWFLLNRDKLPFILVGGCHNGQFNVTLYKTKHSEDYDDMYWTHGESGAECFCWRLVMLPWGGGVACMGATGLTVSRGGEPVSLNGEIEMNVFYMIGDQNAPTPGHAQAGALQKFIQENPVKLTEAHSIAIVHLFGDPTLHFGGFQ